MALFKALCGSRASLETQALHDGYAYFCIDDGTFHIDYVNTNGVLQRKQLNAKDAETLIGMTLEELKIYCKDIIDITTLPESNIDEEVTYRVLNGIFISKKLLRHDSTCYIVAWDTVPTEAGESVLVQGTDDFTYVGYYNIKDNVLYGYFDSNTIEVLKTLVDNSDLSDVLKALAKAKLNSMSTGWKTMEEIVEMVSDYSTITWGGIITSRDSATNENAIYLYLESEMFFYQHGAWVKLHKGLGAYGTGSSSEIFNSVDNIASGKASHAEGLTTTASGETAHAEGYTTIASGNYAHSEGRNTVASGDDSHSEGHNNNVAGFAAHGEGSDNTVNADVAHAEGSGNIISVDAIGAHAEGTDHNITAARAHAEGQSNIVSGANSHGEGSGNTVSGLGGHVEGVGNTSSGAAAHAEGATTIASGAHSHAEGYGTQATQGNAHAEGENTVASGQASHAEGYQTTASGAHSHAEGGGTRAESFYAHAEGHNTVSSEYGAHSEGVSTQATSAAAHAEGANTFATNTAAHAEGQGNTASGVHSHAEGENTRAQGQAAHAEGLSTIAEGANSHAEGGVHTYITGSEMHGTQIVNVKYSTAQGPAAHAEGAGTIAVGFAAHSEGIGTTASGEGAHVEGTYVTYYTDLDNARVRYNEASGRGSHSEGIATIASGEGAHAEGGYAHLVQGTMSSVSGSTASGQFSHAEGAGTDALGTAAHAEGCRTTASGAHSHAEGENTRAQGQTAHAEGLSTIANHAYMHVFGKYNNYITQRYQPTVDTSTVTIYWNSSYYYADSYEFDSDNGYFILVNAQLTTINNNELSAGKYICYSSEDPTAATTCYQLISIKETTQNYIIYNVQQFSVQDCTTSGGKYVQIVGNGTSQDERSNAHTLDWNGNAWYSGDIKIGGTDYDDETASTLATQNYVNESIASLQAQIDELTNIINNLTVAVEESF